MGSTVRRRARRSAAAVAAIAVATGLVVAGRLSAGGSAAHDGGYQPGYAAGVRAGEAQGRAEGRALEEGAAAPTGSAAAVQSAFDKAYAAGQNDVFAGYDGGWTLSTPYVVTLAAGSDAVVYRLDTRTLFQPGIDYYLCPDGHNLCQQARP